MKRFLMVLTCAIAACSSAKESSSPPPAPKTEPAKSAAVDPACAESAAKLKAWVRDLIADGKTFQAPAGGRLVTLTDEAPRPFDFDGDMATVTSKDIAKGGAVVATRETKNVDAVLLDAFKLHKGVLDANDLKQPPPPEPAPRDLALMIEQDAPWSWTAKVLDAAANSGHANVTLVFVAGAPGRTAAPAPSSIDAKVAELGKQKGVAGLAAPEGSTLADGAFKTCPMPSLAVSDRDAALPEAIANAVTDCGCKVEIPAIQRLLWATFGRDGAPLVTMQIALSNDPKTATKIAEKADAPWSATHVSILAAAKQGKPITVR
jgi:hypothetical protein